MEKRPCSSLLAKLERNLHHRSLRANGFELIDFAIPADNGKTRVGTKFVAAIQQTKTVANATTLLNPNSLLPIRAFYSICSI